jgi:hypothetical protein
MVSSAAASCIRRHLLLLNFIEASTSAKLNWHIAYQALMAIFYVALSIRLIQLILAFRGGE